MLCSHTHSCVLYRCMNSILAHEKCSLCIVQFFFLCVHSSFLLTNTYGLPSRQRGCKMLIHYFNVYIIFCGVALLVTLKSKVDFLITLLV